MVGKHVGLLLVLVLLMIIMIIILLLLSGEQTHEQVWSWKWNKDLLRTTRGMGTQCKISHERLVELLSIKKRESYAS